MNPTKVLIVGAGPTGLVLALWLTRLGVAVRIIDKAAQPGSTSRAVAVQARTLELYEQLNLAEPLVKGGVQVKGVNFWVKGTRAGHAELGAMGRGLSPYPYMLVFPQDAHERLLIERLADAGVRVERSTELVGFEPNRESVTAHLRRTDGSVEEVVATYLAGCDGASSIVRSALNAGFPGGTYSHVFYVADIEGSGPTLDGELHIELGESDFLAVFPLASSGRARLIGTVREEVQTPGRVLTWEDVNTRVIEDIRMQISKVNWFSTYRVHHRVAANFRRDRVFLVGDAAHIHSPVGGQGMNTGIADAINLAWKLAGVLQGNAATELLDTYEVERRAFARRLVATTDRVFQFVTRTGTLAKRVRVDLAPKALETLLRSTNVQRFMFRTVSQTMLNYRGSSLSEGNAGHVQGGDRLPWVKLDDHSDNFAPLSGLDWQVHVYGEPSPGLRERCAALNLSLHVFPWSTATQQTKLGKDAAYLLRPDGYVALAAPTDRATKALQRYFEKRKLRRAR